VEGPFIRIEETGAVVSLSETVTTIGRGSGVDVRLSDPSVSRLHAEIICRGPYAYVADLGLSRNGTRVNGRLVARRVLEDGDVLSFGTARCRVGGLPREDLAVEVELRRSASPELTRRELDVLTSLCRPALSDEAFVAPATAREIAADLVVTEAAVKQHLLRLYQKFRIAEGANRRVRLANEVIALGLVRPMPPADRAEPGQARAPADRGEPVPGNGPAPVPVVPGIAHSPGQLHPHGTGQPSRRRERPPPGRTVAESFNASARSAIRP
jgi:FHA domain